jgi:hypothetical protein
VFYRTGGCPREEVAGLQVSLRGNLSVAVPGGSPGLGTGSGERKLVLRNTGKDDMGIPKLERKGLRQWQLCIHFLSGLDSVALSGASMWRLSLKPFHRVRWCSWAWAQGSWLLPSAE